jgi:predicted nucleotidyltransferase
MQKGLISFAEVIALAEDNSDKIKRDSILDAVPVLADLNLLTPADLEKLSDSDNNLVRNLAVIIKDDIRLANLEKPESAVTHDKKWLRNLTTEIESDLNNVEKIYQEQKSLPPARASWEKQRNTKNVLEKYAVEISTGLIDGSLLFSDLEKFSLANPTENYNLISIYSLRQTAEKLAAIDLKQAQEFAATSEALMRKLWESNIPEIQVALESTWLRWAAAGIINQDYLDQFEIKAPRLDTPFSLDQINTSELKELAKITKKIETDPKLAKLLYPVSIVYGSRIKGYGTKLADIDLAVFAKPNNDAVSHSEVQKILTELLQHEKIGGRALEFRLVEKDDKLEIEDLTSLDKSVGNSAFSHVLFGGAWCGQPEAIKELYEKLMTGYLHSKDKKIESYDARQLWLREMERDTLQYRLMHKGYTHFKPEQGRLQTKNSKAIDAESTFWDPGYRRMATKLFIEKVFIPQL